MFFTIFIRVKYITLFKDGTVRLWSLGEQRCVRVFQISELGIWSLAVDPNFRYGFLIIFLLRILTDDIHER